MNGRHWMMALTLLATLVVAFRQSGPEADYAAPALRLPNAVADRQASGEVAAGQLREVQSSQLELHQRDGAASTAPLEAAWWGVAPWALRSAAPLTPEAAPPLHTVMPPPVAAPALPFRVIGRYAEDEQPAVFVQYNDQNLVLRAGDVVAATYRVDSLAATQMTFTFLPMNVQQILEIGAAP